LVFANADAVRVLACARVLGNDLCERSIVFDRNGDRVAVRLDQRPATMNAGGCLDDGTATLACLVVDLDFDDVCAGSAL